MITHRDRTTCYATPREVQALFFKSRQEVVQLKYGCVEKDGVDYLNELHFEHVVRQRLQCV